VKRRSGPRLSVIVPVLNEGGIIRSLLESLQPLRAAGHEVVVVDGGSTDETLARVDGLADQVLTTSPGRAAQMNTGARSSSGDILWFLHADSVFPPGAAQAIGDCLRGGDRVWGRFDVRLSGRRVLLRVVERAMNWRSRLTGIATGDQGIFVRRSAFFLAGGFPTVPLMEDIALSRRLRRMSPPAALPGPILTSARRWERRGPVKTVLLMWRLRLAFALGADPAKLARLYGTCPTPRHGS
jgi:rSAM/selenodomain-associated transferase 2